MKQELPFCMKQEQIFFGRGRPNTIVLPLLTAFPFFKFHNTLQLLPTALSMIATIAAYYLLRSSSHASPSRFVLFSFRIHPPLLDILACQLVPHAFVALLVGLGHPQRRIAQRLTQRVEIGPPECESIFCRGSRGRSW